MGSRLATEAKEVTEETGAADANAQRSDGVADDH
jgi:hypothetical protein